MSEQKLSTYEATRTGYVYPIQLDHLGVTGVVAAHFTDYGHVYVTTVGHINDDLTVVTYRGTEFLAAAHFRLEGGEWVDDGSYRGKATRRDNWSDGTAKQSATIREALRSVMPAVWAERQDAARAAELQQATFVLESAQRDLDELTAKVKDVRKVHRAATRRLQAAKEAAS